MPVLASASSELFSRILRWLEIREHVRSIILHPEMFTSKLNNLYHSWTVISQISKIFIYTHLKLCVATATHNFKWVEMTTICIIWIETLQL